EDLTPDQMRANLLDPFGFDARDAAAEQARGLDQFRTHDPFAGLLGQTGARMRPEAHAARAEIAAGLRTAGLLGARADVAQQARQQRLVDDFITGGDLVGLPAMFAAQGRELAMHVTPLALAQMIQEVLPAPGLLPAAGTVAIASTPAPPPVH